MATSATASAKASNHARGVIPWLIFPVLTTAIIGGAIVTLGRGGGVGGAALVFTILGWASVMLLERVFPHSDYWNVSQGDVGTDGLHLLFSGILAPRLVHVLVSLGLMGVAASLSTAAGFGFWPHDLPLVVQLALALVVGELTYYWWHRCAHEKELLWRLHVVHHSPRRLYFLNAARFHPIDMAVGYAAHYAPLILLGANEQTIMLFTLFTSIHGLLQHANIELRLGWLNWVFSMAELHRWHHSLDVAKANSNYGSNLIIWDALFGTRYLPGDQEHPPEDVGVAHLSAFPQGYLGQLMVPLRWRQIQSASE